MMRTQAANASTSLRSDAIAGSAWLLAGRLAMGLGSLVCVRILTFELPAGLYADLVLVVGVVSLRDDGGPCAADECGHTVLSRGQPGKLARAASGYGRDCCGWGSRYRLDRTLLAWHYLGIGLVDWPYSFLPLVLCGSVALTRFWHAILNVSFRRGTFALLAVFDVFAGP